MQGAESTGKGCQLVAVSNRKECRKGAGRPTRVQLRKLAPKNRCAGAVQDGVRNILHMASALRQAMRAQPVAALQPQQAAQQLPSQVASALICFAFSQSFD